MKDSSDDIVQLRERKNDHLRINLEENVQSGLTTGLEHYQFMHRSLPELNLEDVRLDVHLWGYTLKAPLLISSMTGGTKEAEHINQILAEAAQATGIALGVGSQRAALEESKLAKTFQVRNVAPNILLFANLGAVQLNYGYGIEECKRAVEMIGADALILHLNPLQEALQAEGNTRFHGLLKRIEQVCSALPVPVIVKEVGWGFCETDVSALAGAGVAAIDVAGAGGTSWSQVEKYRSTNIQQAKLAAAFVDWGIPTVQSILNAKKVAPHLTIFASGGLRSGIDIAKCIALGATLGGMASPFLHAAAKSLKDTVELILQTQREIQICMFTSGIADIDQMQKITLHHKNQREEL